MKKSLDVVSDNMKHFNRVLDLSNALVQKEQALIARAGAQGAQIFGAVIEEAFGEFGGGDYMAYLSGAQSLLAHTSDPEQIVQLERLAARLQMLAPEQGFENALQALQQLMSGESASIAEQFNLSSSMLQNSEVRMAGLSGNIESFITAMDLLLNQQNMTEEALARMLDQPAQKWDKILNTFKYKIAEAGRGGLDAFRPLLDMIHKALDEGKFQPFFDAISIGMQIIADVTATAASIIVENLDFVKSLLLMIGAVLAVLAVKMLLTWFGALWPILSLIGAVVGLMNILDVLGVSVGDVVGFITGVFYGLFAFLWNRVAFVYNLFLSLAEFLVNLFIDPVYAVKKLFFDLIKHVGDFFGDIINAIIKGINFLLKKINIFGKDLSIDPVDFSKGYSPEPTSSKNVVDFSKSKMEMKDISEQFNIGFDKGSSFASTVSDALNGFTVGDSFDPNNDTINKVNEVGRINETVDISSEDLKTMRELAEMNSIQNFVSLTPTVQVTTGDLHQEADIDVLVSRIERKLEDEFNAVAEGVYA